MTWLITLSENNCSVVAFTKRNRSSHPRCSVRKGVLRNFVKFTRKHLCHSIFFNKVPGLRPATLLKNRLWHRCFPVNFAKFLRTPFLQNTSGRLLLKAIFFSWTELLENLLLAKYLISVTLTLHFVGCSLDISWNHENENCGTSKKSKPCFRFLYPK